MPTLTDTRYQYAVVSTKTSDIARQAALAGLGLVWIFHDGTAGASLKIPHGLRWPTFVLVAALVFDFMQAAVATTTWGVYNRYKEKQLNLDEDVEFTYPRRMIWPSLGLFIAKLVALTVAYGGLLAYLARTL